MNGEQRAINREQRSVEDRAQMSLTMKGRWWRTADKGKHGEAQARYDRSQIDLLNEN